MPKDTINLQKDYKTALKFIKRKVDTFKASARYGPGDNSDPIKFIELGYEYGQNGYIALVFDTRVNASRDGSWTCYIQENVKSFPEWNKVIDYFYDEKEPIKLITIDGKEFVFSQDGNVTGNFDELDNLDEIEDFKAYFIGEMLKKAMITTRKEDIFSQLPLTEDAFMGIEHSEGAYGWPNYEGLKTEGKL